MCNIEMVRIHSFLLPVLTVQSIHLLVWAKEDAVWNMVIVNSQSLLGNSYLNGTAITASTSSSFINIIDGTVIVCTTVGERTYDRK